MRNLETTLKRPFLTIAQNVVKLQQTVAVTCLMRLKFENYPMQIEIPTAAYLKKSVIHLS